MGVRPYPDERLQKPGRNEGRCAFFVILFGARANSVNMDQFKVVTRDFLRRIRVERNPLQYKPLHE